MLRVYALPSVGTKTAVGLEVSVSSFVSELDARLRF